jgi:predicted SAM-dependent methyltransferase
VKRLELGSGYNPAPGFKHLDANENVPELDYVGSCYPLPQSVVDDAPFDELRAVDVLEHLSYRVADLALGNWRQVVSSGARMYVQVPDADRIMHEYAQRTRRQRMWTADGSTVEPIVGAEWRLLGGHNDGTFVHDGDDWRWNAHYSLWSRSKLTSRLSIAGWRVESLITNAHPNLCCWAVAL